MGMTAILYGLDDHYGGALKTVLHLEGIAYRSPRDADTLNAVATAGGVLITSLSEMGNLPARVRKLPRIILGAGPLPTARDLTGKTLGQFSLPVPVERIVTAIRTEALLQLIAVEQRERKAEAGIGALTQREYQVARLVVAGFTTKQIAARLGLSPWTVKGYRQGVMGKLGVPHIAELVRIFTTYSI